MIKNSKTIDLITFKQAECVYELIAIVEQDECKFQDIKWLLQEKINAYLIYALDGQLFVDYSNAAGSKVEILVQAHGDLPDDFRPFFTQLVEAVTKEGLTLKFEKL